LPVTATYEDGGTTHTWENDSAVNESGTSFVADCGGDEPVLHLDFTGNTSLAYQGSDPPIANDSVGAIVDYAFAEMGPTVDLRVEKQGNGNSAGVQLDESSGEVVYDSSGDRVVTFLHVTENAVNVTVD
jgi:hypothetical protein